MTRKTTYILCLLTVGSWISGCKENPIFGYGGSQNNGTPGTPVAVYEVRTIAAGPLRHQPTNEDYTAHPYFPDTKIENQQGIAEPDQEWSVTREAGDWLHLVPLSRSGGGWFPRDLTVRANNSKPMIIVADETPFWDSIDSNKPINTAKRGDLVFVEKSEGSRSQIVANDGKRYWANTSDFSDDTMNMIVARLLRQARACMSEDDLSITLKEHLYQASVLLTASPLHFLLMQEIQRLGLDPPPIDSLITDSAKAEIERAYVQSLTK